MVPYGGDPIHVSDPGKLAFGAKGNEDRLGLFLEKKLGLKQLSFDAGVAEVKQKIPLTVEIHPMVSYQLGAQIFGARNLCFGFHHVSPFRSIVAGT